MALGYATEGAAAAHHSECEPVKDCHGITGKWRVDSRYEGRWYVQGVWVLLAFDLDLVRYSLSEGELTMFTRSNYSSFCSFATMLTSAYLFTSAEVAM